MTKKLSILALTLLAVIGCNSPTEPRNSKSVQTFTIFRGITSEAGPPRRELITSQARLDQVWEELWILSPDTPWPPVDFSKQSVILSALGGGACNETLIDSVTLREELTVDIRDRFIDETKCGCVSVAANPVHIVAINRVNLRASFLVRKVVSCERF